MILKLMILSSLHVYELIVTTSSLSSFRKPKSTLETPVMYVFVSLYERRGKGAFLQHIGYCPTDNWKGLDFRFIIYLLINT